MQSTNMHKFYRVAIIMASIAISTRAQAVSTSDLLAKSIEIQGVVDLMKTNFDSHSDTVEDQLEDLHGRSETRKTNREKTDGRRLPIWSAVITRSTKGLSGQSTKYKAAFRKVIADRVSTLGDLPNEGSMQESIAQYAKIALGVRDEHLSMEPSRESYIMYQHAIKNLREVASQRVLEDEVNENESVLQGTTRTANAIRTWSYINLAVVVAVLLILTLGFMFWFCWVARRKRLEDAAQRQRAGARAERGVEMRIAGQVAHEIAPLVPSAPLHHQRPYHDHQSR